MKNLASLKYFISIILIILAFSVKSQIALPWTESFENIGPTKTFTSTTPSINGSSYWSYNKTAIGRLRLNAGLGYYKTGSAALTLDCSSNGTNSLNEAIATLQLQNYSAITNLVLDFWAMDHGDETSTEDAVYIRGANTASWIKIVSLTPSSWTNGTWVHFGNIDIDSAITANSQTITSTFQIKFSQYDNYMSTSTTSTDGITFDDINITGSLNLPNNIGMLQFTSFPPFPGLISVTADLKNYGTNTLTSTNINWSVNGVTQGSTQNWTGALALGQTTSITLGNHNFVGSTSYNFKAWTSLPNGFTDPEHSNDTTLAPNVRAAAIGTYTINSANPTSGSNFNSFNEAVAYIASSGVCGPVIFNVASGTYNEQVSFGEIYGTSSVNTITFKSASTNPDDVILQYNSVNSSGSFTLELNSSKFISFKYMTLKALGATYGRVVELKNGANYNTISFNKIIASITSTTNSCAGIYSSNSSDNFNEITNNEITGGFYSIYLRGTSNIDREVGNIINNNIMKDYYYYGGYIYNQDSIEFKNNVIENRPTSVSVYGGRFYYCSNIKLSGNKINIHGTSTHYGLYINNFNGTSTNPNKIINNFISITGTGTNNWYGIYLINATYVDIVYNSIKLIGEYSNSQAFSQTQGSNQTIKNNIFVNTGGGYSYYINTPTAIISSNYNNYYSSGSYIGYWTANIADLSSLKIANSKDQYSLSVNPIFASNSDLHLNDSIINGRGTPITGITTDIDGENRNATSPDIGADEFTLRNNDAGITSLDEPFTPCPGSNTNIIVTLKNFGLTSLDSCKINWSINGVLQSTLNYTGSLLTGNDTTINLGSYTFSNGINYNMKIWSSLPNGFADQKNSNDTIFKYGIQTALPTGTYTIGPDTTYDFSSFTDAFNSLYSNGICGPIIFNVASATYNEQLTIFDIPGSSSINTITLKSLSGNYTDVTIQYTSIGSGDNWTIRLNGADYVTIKDMTIKANNSLEHATGIELINGAHYNTIIGNKIYSACTSSSNSRCIYDNTTQNHFNSYQNNNLDGGYYGFYLNGLSNYNLNISSLIINNEIHGFKRYGIYAYRQDSIQILNNFIHDGIGTNYYGIYCSYCFNKFSISGNNINLSPTTYAYGIYTNRCNYYSTSSTSGSGLVSNNFISIYTGTSSSHGIYAYNSDNTKYYYNSINITGVNTGSLGLLQTNIASNLIGEIFKNNIFANQVGGVSMRIQTPANVSASDYNVIYSTGNTLAYWGTNATSLSALQTISGKDSNSLSINPGFLSATDLHLNSSAINGQGTPIPGILTDFDGENRNATSPDIGADEFNLNNNDAGILNLVEPVSPCPNTISVMKVDLKNYGLSNLTTCAINWTINGVAQSPVNFSGNISFNTSTTVVLGNYTFLNGITYSIKAWPTNPNGQADPNSLNDTLFVNNFKTSLASGIYTIGTDTTYDFNSFSSAINAMQVNGICGPVVFQADTGTFNEKIIVPYITGTSPTNTITFKGHGANTILTYSNTTSTDRAVFLLNAANYVHIDSFKIVIQSNTSGGHCIHLMNHANNNKISNCILDASMNTSNCGGIAVASDVYSHSSFADCNKLEITNNTIIGGRFGIYVNGTSSNHINGFLIEDNTIVDFYREGIYMKYADSTIVRRNKISSRATNTTGKCIYFNQSHSNSEISQNEIIMNYTTAGRGIELGSCKGTALKPFIVSNNMICQTNSTTTNILYGIYSSYGNNIYYYNNSINLKGGGSNSRALFVSGSVNDPAFSNIKIKNNIISNQGSGYSIYFNGQFFPAKVTECSYNNLYSTGTNLAYYWGNATNINAWKAFATNLGYNSISQNPVFTNDTNLHLTNTSPNNLGNPIPGITIDIDGETRSLTTPDMGADERNYLAHDLLITNFISPNNSMCGSISDSIRVVVKSLGLNSETNVPITATVNTPSGVINVSSIIPSIPPAFNGTITVGAINTTSPGNYSYKVYPTLAFDLNHSNDTIIGNTSTEYPIGIPHMENFNNSGPYNWTGNNFTVSNIGSHGLTSKALSANLNSTINSAISNFNKKIASITPNTYLSFKYRITNYSGGATILNGDSLNVLISTNCGNSFSILYTIDSINHQPSTSMNTVILPIGNFANTEIKIAFNTIRSTGNYWVDIDDVGIAEAPIVNLGNDTIICSGDSCTFDAGSYTPYNVTYKWYSVGNPTILGTSQLFSTSSTASYYVEVENQYGIIGRDTISLTFDSIPIINLGTNLYICGGNSKTLNVGLGAGYSYLWSNNSTTQIISIDSIGYGLGTHLFWVIVTNSNGCSTTDSIDVTFLPGINVNIGPDAIICANDSISLNASPGLLYFWSDSSTTQSISVDTVGFGLGMKTVWLMVSDSIGCKATDTVSLTFVANPIVDLGTDTTIKYSNGAIILDAGSGFTSYLWDNMSLVHLRQIFASVVGLGTHTYYVEVTDSNGCMASDTIIVEVIDDTGINDKYNNSSISLIPNPTKGLFKILINGIEGNFNLQIIDLKGKIISNEKLTGVKSGYIKEFDVSYFAKGIYYIKLMNNDIIKLEKLVIQ